MTDALSVIVPVMLVNEFKKVWVGVTKTVCGAVKSTV